MIAANLTLTTIMAAVVLAVFLLFGDIKQPAPARLVVIYPTTQSVVATTVDQTLPDTMEVSAIGGTKDNR